MAKKTSFLQKKKTFSQGQMLVFVLAFAVVGTYAIYQTFAASRLPAANSGSISVYTPDGTAPRYQGQISFNATGASTLKNPRVWVACYQNNVLVYGEGGSPSSILTLGGGSSQWVLNNGGPANCTADLYYILNKTKNGEWNGNGAQDGNVYLGHTTFDAAG